MPRLTKEKEMKKGEEGEGAEQMHRLTKEKEMKKGEEGEGEGSEQMPRLTKEKQMKKGEEGEGEGAGGEGEGGPENKGGASLMKFMKDHPVLTTGLAIGGAGLVAGPLALVAVVQSVGFGVGGIAAGSWAAGFMGSYGGAVAAGSACATLQSVGAAGLGAAGTAAASLAAGTIGGGVAAGTAAAVHRLTSSTQPPLTDVIKENLLAAICAILSAIEQILTLPPAQGTILELIRSKGSELQEPLSSDNFLMVVDELLAAIDGLLSDMDEEPDTEEHGDEDPNIKAVIKQRLIEAKIIREDMNKKNS